MRIAIAAALFGLLLAAPAATADESMSASPPNRYSSTSVEIDQGEKVTFTNYDTVEHDVVARENGPDGKPLFGSALVSRGASAPVKGTEYLTTGSYDFLCSLHPQMTGKFTVTSKGTPVPRPSSGSGGGSPSPSPEPGGADSAAPKASLRLLDSRVSSVRRSGALRLRVTTDEAATLRLTARAGKRTLGTVTTKVTAAGTKTVRLRLTRAAKARLRRARSLKVSLTARVTDAAGNAATAKGSRTLRR